MNQLLLLSVGAIFMLMLTASGVMMMRQSHQQERFAARVRLIHGQKPLARHGTETDIRVASLRAIAGLGQMILRTGLLSARTRADLENTLATSGLHGANGLAAYIGFKILMVAGLPVLSLVLLHNVGLPGMVGTILPPASGVLGLLAIPGPVLGRRRKKYQAHLDLGLPDALDMMVICAQAGLGLGPAIVRVSIELQNAHWETAQELAQTANELQMVSDSRIALTNLGARTGIEGYKRLASTLIQTMQYGTPLTDALRILSAEMRQDALTKFEARAARLPVMLTMPTILFILPCVFLIAGGPAIIQIMRAFN